jgi:hypothetical protein
VVSSPDSDVAGIPIRVSIRKSALDPSLWVVRALSEGAAPPPGARAGSLVVFGAEEDDEGDSSNGSAVGSSNGSAVG